MHFAFISVVCFLLFPVYFDVISHLISYDVDSYCNELGAFDNLFDQYAV